ncbi:VOC family protein [Actinocorallia sp. A-T 12471]|uniref:VOC family protein n=1 Tax=Actinocorallia sp. A-T 12471 TaxID=3089813 RepID=UPI0029D2B1D3|nr:VOC family protein [Actinocorallia sp. A-T 12471]MDX6740446.1 VOC family protein [Actinocorallia sp. A-T 12471]
MVDMGLGREGTFCWMDVKTRDVAGTGAFLTEVFGWSAAVDESDWRRATTVSAKGRPVGTLSDLSLPVYPPGTPAHAAFYLRVTDVDRRARAAAAAGGRVLLPPFDAGDQGRIATLLDVAGAAFSLWEPPADRGWHYPDRTAGLPARMVLACERPAEAEKFYRALLGEAPARCDFVAGAHPGPAQWQCTISVDDPAAVADRARRLAPATNPPGKPEVSTPEGVTFALTPTAAEN